MNAKFSDFKLITNGKEIPCHRYVLYKECVYFKNLFDSIDEKQTANNNFLEFPQFSYEILNMFIEILYNSSDILEWYKQKIKCNDISDSLIDLFIICDYFEYKLQFESIIKLIEDNLKTKIINEKFEYFAECKNKLYKFPKIKEIIDKLLCCYFETINNETLKCFSNAEIVNILKKRIISCLNKETCLEKFLIFENEKLYKIAKNRGKFIKVKKQNSNFDSEQEFCPICRNCLTKKCVSCESIKITKSDCDIITFCKIGHAYHLDCIAEWLLKRQCCPLDNYSLTLCDV